MGMPKTVTGLASITALLLFVSFGAATVSFVSGDNCRLQIQRLTTNYIFRCVGTCETGGEPACELRTVGGETSQWWCSCNGSGMTYQKCWSQFVVDGGVSSLLCNESGCMNDCTKPTLPTAAGVWTKTCACPDADA